MTETIGDKGKQWTLHNDNDLISVPFMNYDICMYGFLSHSVMFMKALYMIHKAF